VAAPGYEIKTERGTSDATRAREADSHARDPKFGEVLNKIQSQYGAKAEKPREPKKTLGKDDFMRIMITQMKFQDPTQPLKADQFAAQLAQYSSVEQLQNINQAVSKLHTQNQPLERLAMTQMIGKTILIDRDRFTHGDESAETLAFHLPKDAASVHLAILDERGDSVLEKDLGELKSGAQSFYWDGRKANSMPAKSGNYAFRVTAKDGNGSQMQLSPKAQARIFGVSYEGAEPVFLVGNPNKPERVPMRNVGKIEDAMPAGAGGIQMVAAEAGAPKASIADDPGLQQLLRAKSQAPTPEAQPEARAADQAEGFPNGLSKGGDSE